MVTKVETEVANHTKQEEHLEGVQPQEKKSVETKENRKENEKQADMHDPTPPISYPQRLKKNRMDKQFTKFMEVFKKWHINIPFADALEHMPSNVKFMKDILAKKRRLSDYETINLTGECSVILQRKLQKKLKNPSSFTIPCKIGNVIF